MSRQVGIRLGWGSNEGVDVDTYERREGQIKGHPQVDMLMGGFTS